MKAVPTPSSDLTLTLEGAGEDRNLPAERITCYDAELGETPEDGHPALLTVWEPDPGERRALANGAKVELIVHGRGHPPVSMGVGDPDPEGAEALLSRAHADRAIKFLLCDLGERLARAEGLGTPEEVADLWHKALEATKAAGDTEVDLGQRIQEAQQAVDAAGPDSGYGIKNSLGHWYYGEDDFGENRESALIYSDLQSASAACEALRESLRQQGIEVVPVPPIDEDGKS